MLLDQETSGLKKKIKSFSEVCKIYCEEFVTFTKTGKTWKKDGYVTNVTNYLSK